MKRHVLAGTLAAATALAAGFGASAAGVSATPVASTQNVSFTIYLPLRNTAAMKALLTAQQTKGSPSYHQWLTPAQVAAQFGPAPATFAQAEAALTAAGLQVTATHIRSIDVTGPAGAVNQALQTSLKSITASNGGSRIISSTKVIVPSALAQVGASIPSFANVPEHHLNSSLLTAASDNRNGPAGSYNYNDLKQAYDYPAYTSLDGTGANVAIVMENAPRNEDVAAMFNHENFTTTTGGKAPPTFIYVPIDGGGIYQGPGSGGTDEAELDAQMVLGGAPGANVYFVSVPNLSDNEILNAYSAILDSPVEIVTSSFGLCELFYTPAFNDGYDFTFILGIYDEIIQIGNMEGITWFASSGDNAGLGCPSVSIVPYLYGVNTGVPVKFVKGVETPAADPNVTAVGGGNLITTFTATTPPGQALNSAYISEQGFGDPEIPNAPYGAVNITGGYWGAGGGVSTVFAMPPWQSLVNVPTTSGRNVPDIGMLVGGCPGGISKLPCGPDRSAVVVTIGAPAGSNGVGYRYGFIGTSVASPELAGAFALLVEAAGKGLGNINPGLYGLSATQIATPVGNQFYHQGIRGFDGAFGAYGAPGYNYIYGNGSPDVRNLFGLTSLPAAGVPRTASNP